MAKPIAGPEIIPVISPVTSPLPAPVGPAVRTRGIPKKNQATPVKAGGDYITTSGREVRQKSKYSD